MIVFYTSENSKRTQIKTIGCNAICSENCLKPKNTCCNKYKKKGINCKRCPNILLEKAS